MFLVVISHTMDDIPVGLYDTRAAADKAAAAIDSRACEVSSQYGPTAYWTTDASTPCGVRIVEFAHMGEGRWLPNKVEFIRNLDD